MPIQHTNEARKLTMDIVPGVTFAVFHVHTVAAEPHPSPADRAIADRYGLTVYTLHTEGLFKCDPDTKKITEVREGVNWLQVKPARRRSRSRLTEVFDEVEIGPHLAASNDQECLAVRGCGHVEKAVKASLGATHFARLSVGWIIQMDSHPIL